MSAMDERTALSFATTAYDATESGHSIGDDTAAAEPADGTPTTTATPSRRFLPRLVVAASAALTLVLFVSTVLLLLVVPGSFTTSPRGDTTAQQLGSQGDSVDPANLDTSADTPGRVIPSMQPFSTTDPKDAHCPHMDRPSDTWPSSAWGALANVSVSLHTSLPTNAWWENIVLGFPTQEKSENSLVAIPYTYDVAGDLPGLRIHFPRVIATDLIVQTAFDWRHAVQLGCVESVSPHYVSQPGPLSVTLNWNLEEGGRSEPAMSVPAVRGSPYVTMEYRGVRPVISARQEVTGMMIDGESLSLSSGCSNSTAIRVEREVEISFAGGAVSSDDTWLIFFSAPMDFLCSSWFAMERGDPPTPGAIGPLQRMPRFRLESVAPVKFAVVRAAMVTTCTSGIGTRCETRGVADDRADYAELLRAHAEVYPTGEARVAYSSSSLDWIQNALDGDINQAAIVNEAAVGVDVTPADEDSSSGRSSSDSGGGGTDEEGSLRFLWAPRRMDGKPIAPGEGGGGRPGSGNEEDTLIMFSLPHHRTAFSAADGLTGLQTSTLHGQAEVATGNEWSMKVVLPPVSFGVGRPVREEMVNDVNKALDADIQYEIPANYLRGEGDTYFSGKMLAKMGRIALIAEEMGRHDEAMAVAARLAEASQVWLNGTAASPLIYDFRWGGVMTCGCAYVKGEGCTNGIGPDKCPALSNPGMNFGLGFYNDHHFHFGYHIFAAAIVAKFYPEWGVKHHEAVTLFIRDIANPSSADPFFPVFRHKDWFLGSSWALGIPTLGGTPYANGRNEESSSEAVNAYYGVALYGHVMAQVFSSAGEPAKAQTASLIRDTGRQLLATEVQSAQIYWQVANADTPGMPRVYPEAYRPHVVGMLWSTLAQMQTWFGAEAWKVYGIQMLPITAVSEQLLAPRWVEQMLPSFEDSCLYDSNPIKACVVDGWSMLVHAGQAITGRWEEGRDGILALPDGAFETAGGNGHSRTSMLWFVANRPAPNSTET